MRYRGAERIALRLIVGVLLAGLAFNAGAVVFTTDFDRLTALARVVRH